MLILSVYGEKIECDRVVKGKDCVEVYLNNEKIRSDSRIIDFSSYILTDESGTLAPMDDKELPTDFPTIQDLQNQITQMQLALINLGSQDSAIYASLVEKDELSLSDVPTSIKSEVQSALSAV